MTVSLPPRLADFVEQQIKSGRYDSAEDVVAGALARLQTEQEFSGEELRELRAELATGLEQAARGESEDWDINEIREEGRRLLEKSKRDSKDAPGQQNA